MENKSEKVWIEFEGSLRKFIAGKVSEPEDVEDLLQNVFIKLYENIDKLYDKQKIKSWIFTVARNAINDYYRLKYKSPVQIEISEDVISDLYLAETDYNEITKCVLPVINDLPDIYKEAIKLTEYENMTQKEMSEYLGVSISTAKSRVQRARKMIKKTLCDCCTMEFDNYGNVLDYKKKKDTKYC